MLLKSEYHKNKQKYHVLCMRSDRAKLLLILLYLSKLPKESRSLNQLLNTKDEKVHLIDE